MSKGSCLLSSGSESRWQIKSNAPVNCRTEGPARVLVEGGDASRRPWSLGTDRPSSRLTIVSQYRYGKH